MRIGYLLDTHAAPYGAPYPDNDDVADFMDHLIELGQICEDLNFDGLWIPERHMRTETYWPDPFQLMTSLATVTDEIKLGNYTNVLSLHNPMKIAEQIAIIDNLSRGRFVYSGAIGYHEGYWRFFGIENGKENRLGRTMEALEIMEEAFQSDPDNRFSYDGEHFQFDDVFLTPGTYQDPRPPFWIGGQIDKAIKRSGRLGEAWPLDPFPIEEDTFKRQIKLYKDEAKKHDNPQRVVLMRDGFVSENRQTALETFGDPYKEEMLFYFREGILSHHPDFETEDDFTHETLSDHMIIGTPEECIESLEMYEEKYDIDYIVLRCRMPEGPSPEKEKESVIRFGEEVIPHFHDQDDGDWILSQE